MPNKKSGAHLSSIEKQAIAQFLKNLRRKRLLLVSLFLLGSKARGDFTPNSDIDLLAIVQKNQVKKRLYQEVASILSQFGVYLSVKAFSQQEFERLEQFGTPFMENIKREGVILWQKQ